MILVAPSNNIAKTSSTIATDFSVEKLNDVTIIVLYSELGSEYNTIIHALNTIMYNV